MPLTDFLTAVLGDLSLKYTINEKTILVTRSAKKAGHKLKTLPAPLQQREITGRIVNTRGEPLEGVTVSIKNMSIETTKNNEGSYRIMLHQNGRASCRERAGKYVKNTEGATI